MRPAHFDNKSVSMRRIRCSGEESWTPSRRLSQMGETRRHEAWVSARDGPVSISWVPDATGECGVRCSGEGHGGSLKQAQIRSSNSEGEYTLRAGPLETHECASTPVRVQRDPSDTYVCVWLPAREFASGSAAVADSRLRTRSMRTQTGAHLPRMPRLRRTLDREAEGAYRTCLCRSYILPNLACLRT